MATTGPQLGAQRGAEVLYEPVLKVPGQGSAGPSWSAGWWDSQFAPFPLPLLYGQDGGSAVGFPHPGVQVGVTPCLQEMPLPSSAVPAVS